MAYVVKPLPYAYNVLKGLSEQQLKYHHDTHYVAYVNNLNKIEQQLSEARAKGDFSAIRALKLNESFNTSGMVLHELYFDNLGGKGGEPTGKLAEMIKRDFGSFGDWKKEFTEMAKATRGWALLCLFNGRLRNYSVDYHDIGAVWNARPILALDMWEHAYYLDYGPDKGKYLEAFFNNLRWEKTAGKL